MHHTRLTALTTVLALFLLLPACVEDANDTTSADAGMPDTGPSTRPVTEKGPYNVGYRIIEVTYTPEAYGDGEPRELPVSVWYPTNRGLGAAARYFFINRDEVSDEAPIVDGEFPVMMFSHGNGGLKEQSFFMTEHWASHGWIVFSPDHIDNTFRSGTSIEIVSAVYRPQDIHALADRIHSFADDSFFDGHIGDFLAMSGHSMGAVTTLLVTGADIPIDEVSMQCDLGRYDDQGCEKLLTPDRKDLFRQGFLEDRIDVAVPQAPGGAALFQDGVADIDIPSMVFTGGMDRTLPNDIEGDPLWMDMAAPIHRRVNLPDAGHFTFSNMCDFFSGEDRIDSDGCGDEFIEPDRAHDIVNAYSLAFARYHRTMSNDAAALINGDRSPFDPSLLDLTIPTN